jgi:hypothetical protein
MSRISYRGLPVSSRHHPARCVAVFSVHPELDGCGGSAWQNAASKSAAVDTEGEVLDCMVQSRRGKRAAKNRMLGDFQDFSRFASLRRVQRKFNALGNADPADGIRL